MSTCNTCGGTVLEPNKICNIVPSKLCYCGPDYPKDVAELTVRLDVARRQRDLSYRQRELLEDTNEQLRERVSELEAENAKLRKTKGKK